MNDVPSLRKPFQSWKLYYFLFANILAILLISGYHYTAKLFQEPIDRKLQLIYKNLPTLTTNTHSIRLNTISKSFLGTPYELGSLGEGENGEYDQYPLYRLNSFDCLTFVETTIALALSNNPQQFKKKIIQLRYKNGHIAFINRNHFTELDWNINNQKQGFLQDITANFHDATGSSVIKYATVTIDKANWYQYLTSNNIRLKQPLDITPAKHLQQLRAAGAQFKPKTIKVAYIPLNILFDKHNHPNLYVFKQIPTGSVLQIIRPNWNTKERIGTDMVISHLGFVFVHNNQLRFRHASSTQKAVVDNSLISYLRTAKQSPTIKGIHIEKITFHNISP